MIIIAPHPDDELIGCYSRLNSDCTSIKEVWYVFDHKDPVRRIEAEHSADKFKFEPKFLDGLAGLEASLGYLSRCGYNVIVPSIRDAHPQHKEVNRLTRHLATEFYSVDLDYAVGKRGLGLLESARKATQLDMIYPSQDYLWRHNASYYLFENIAFTDIDVLSEVDYIIDGGVQTTVWSDVHVCSMVTGPQELCNLLITSGANSFHFQFDGKEYRL